MRALDEFFHFHRRDAFDQHAGRGHVHGQGHVHHALHQGDFRLTANQNLIIAGVPAGEKARIEALLARCGFATSGLFVMDGSKRSNHGNAYFTGFGKTKRIVFFDTLLGRLQPAEVEAVLAHELGHFKHRHVMKRITLMFAMALAFLAALGQLIGASWFYNGLGVSAQNTALGLVLFFFVVPVFTFLLTPLISLLSRRHEFEADAYAMAQASGADLASALLKLYEDNASTLTPDPLYVKFHYSHPPAVERLARMPSPAPT